MCRTRTLTQPTVDAPAGRDEDRLKLRADAAKESMSVGAR